MIRYKNYAIRVEIYGGYDLGEIKVAKTGKKAGEEIFVNICYPSTLKGCFSRILEIEFKKVVNERDMTIKEALIELDRINKEMTDEFYKNVKEEIR